MIALRHGADVAQVLSHPNALAPFVLNLRRSGGMRMFRIGAIMVWACVALLLSGQHGSANTIIAFHQTVASPAGSTFVSGYIKVQDQSYWGGSLNVHAGNFLSKPGTDLSGTGIIDLRIEVFSNLQGSLRGYGGDPTLYGGTNPVGTWHIYPISSNAYWSIDLSGTAGTLPVGKIVYNNTQSDFTIALNRNVFSGAFNTDAGGPCHFTGVCSFSGYLTVPEPTAMALLGVGILGFGILRRRRWTNCD